MPDPTNLLPPLSGLSNLPSPSNAQHGPFGNIRLSNAHQEGIYNLFTGYSTQSPIPRGDDLLSQIREDLEPRELVNPMITVNYEMYKKIRFFLNEHGVDTPSTGASGGLIVNRLLHTIWNRPEDVEERDSAVAQFKAIKRGTFIPSSPSPSNQVHASAPFSLNQGPSTPQNQQVTAYAPPSHASKGMSSAYSSDAQRFWGRSDEDWLTKLSRYQFMCTQNKVTASDKVNYLHYMLDGAALQFFINEIEGRINNWGEVMKRFHERYASAAKQDYISHRLNELHISQFETGDDASESKALRKTIDELDRLTPMSHPEDRTDRSKMLHLQEAIVGKEWAKTVLSNVSANELKYHTLIERLEYSLQQHQKFSAASHSEGRHNDLRTSRWKSINFAGQGRYGNEPSSRNTIVPKQPHYGANRFSHRGQYSKGHLPRQRFSSASLACHNCGKPGCRWYKCTQPLDMHRVAKNKLKYANEKSRGMTPSTVHLAEVAKELGEDIMEAMVSSQDPDQKGSGEEHGHEDLMAELEDGSMKEAAVNHSASFDLPNRSMDPAGLDLERDRTAESSADFYAGI